MSSADPSRFVVRLGVTNRSPYYLAPWSGDPGRTHVLTSARIYATERGARIALGMARRYRPFAFAEIVTYESEAANE